MLIAEDAMRDCNFKSLSSIFSNHLIFIFYCLCFFRKLRIESFHFLYTSWIQVLEVRIDFSCYVCASGMRSVLQRHVPFKLGSIAVIHEQKFKPIIKIIHEKMNTIEI